MLASTCKEQRMKKECKGRLARARKSESSPIAQNPSLSRLATSRERRKGLPHQEGSKHRARQVREHPFLEVPCMAKRGHCELPHHDELIGILQ